MMNRTVKIIVPCLVALLVTSVFIFLHQIGNSDIFWQIKTGGLVAANGLPTGFDQFSYTMPGASWVDPQWLSELIFFSVDKLFGFTGLSILSLVVGFLMSIILFFGMKKISGSTFISLLLSALILLFSAERFGLLRPELFGFIFFGAFLVIMMQEERFPRRNVILMIALQILWTNMHSSAIIGPFIVLAFAWRDKRVIYLSILLLLSMLLNPFTYKIYLYPINHFLSSYTLQTTSDWKGAGFLSSQTSFMGWSSIAFALVALASMIRKRKIHLPLLIISIVTFISGIWIARFIPFALISMGFLICSLSMKEADEGVIKPAILSAVIVILMIVGSAFASPPLGIILTDDRILFEMNRGVGVGLDRELLPEREAVFIKAFGVKGNMLNDMAYGGYLIYKLWPGRKVFIDTRTPVYGDAFIKRYSEALFDKNSFDKLTKEYDIDYVFYDSSQINAPGGPLKFLLDNPKWHILFKSPKAYIIVRN